MSCPSGWEEVSGSVVGIMVALKTSVRSDTTPSRAPSLSVSGSVGWWRVSGNVVEGIVAAAASGEVFRVGVSTAAKAGGTT